MLCISRWIYRRYQNICTNYLCCYKLKSKSRLWRMEIANTTIINCETNVQSNNKPLFFVCLSYQPIALELWHFDSYVAITAQMIRTR